MATDMTIEDRLITRFNQALGSDFRGLGESAALVVSFKSDLQKLQGKITLKSEKCSPVIAKSVQVPSWKITELEEMVENLDVFKDELTVRVALHQKVLEKIGGKLRRLKQLETMKDYFLLIQDIQNISQELTVSIDGKDDGKTIALYVALSGPNSIVDRLTGVQAPHLQMYARNTAFYWHDILRDKYSIEFESLLKIVKWPILNQTLEHFNPSKDHINKLTMLAEYLFLVKVPGDHNLLSVKLAPSIICPPFTTPVELFVKPFRQRFQFHFNGNKQTNRLDKPEWYLTQILTWAKDNHVFVGQNFQSAAIRAGITNSSVRLEFVRGLVQLAIEKLVVDIEAICQDEALFAHLIDEILAFEQEMKNTLNYPSSLPSAISVLVQPKYLLKWMAIEEKFTTDKMDAMLDTQDPFALLDPADLDELKIPKCADQFIRLLDAIRERYCSLPQPGQQLQFLDLQLKLIDNFRRRLVQLYNSPMDIVNPTKILNAVNYVNSVLREWDENVHYLHLHAALCGPNTDDVGSVFEKTVEELEHWQRSLMENLVTWVVHEITTKSRPYRYDVWPTMQQLDRKEKITLSHSAGEMFQVMVNHLHDLENELSANVFSIVLRMIAHQLDEWMISNMIMNTKFSTGGATQFQYDMVRNLLALFGQYVRKPQTYFKRINDACLLLTLPLGSAMLLRETLRTESNEEAVCTSLKEIGLTFYNKSSTLDILMRRNDMT